MFFIDPLRKIIKNNKPALTVRNSDSNYKKMIKSSITKSYMHDYEGALNDINEALKQKPYLEDLYLQRGKIKEAINDFAGAKSDYSKAIMLNADFDLAYLSRGLLRIKEQDYIGAKYDLNKAKELNSELDETHLLNAK